MNERYFPYKPDNFGYKADNFGYKTYNSSIEKIGVYIPNVHIIRGINTIFC